jgi:hypothetical protein
MPRVEFQEHELTAEDFIRPHPNDRHIIGVNYDPIECSAYVPTPRGEVRAEIGDRIIRDDAGRLYVNKKQR